MRIFVGIPARLESSRLPEKVLKIIGDKPMVRWVYEAAKKCDFVEKVVVAADDVKIVDVVKGFGGQVEMTDVNHVSGTDRIAELVTRHPDYDIYVNLQCDMPFFQEATFRALVTPFFENEETQMTTVACPIKDELTMLNPNTVKVILDKNHNAITFSRNSMPYNWRASDDLPVFHHLGVYAFTKDFLLQYSRMNPTPLQLHESLEQLKVIENGYSIRVEIVKDIVYEVNTVADLERAQNLYLIK